jgi:hypothetical protein
VDNGAFKHVTKNNELFTNMKDGKRTPKIKIASGIVHQVAGKGTFVIFVEKKNEINEEFFYVHGVNSNLLFVGVLTDNGMVMFFNFQKVFILNSQHNIVGTGNKNLVNRLYKLFVSHELLCASMVSTNDLICLWHQCLGHLNVQSLHLLSQNCLAINMPSISTKGQFCQACTLSKHSRKNAPKRNLHYMKTSFDPVHIDVCGPFNNTFMFHAHYILTFIDDYIKFGWVQFLKKKNDVFFQFKQFKAKIQL